MDKRLESLAHIEPPEPLEQQRSSGRVPPPTVSRVLGILERLAVTVDSADAAPTAQANKAVEDTIAQLQVLVAQWEAIKR